MLWHCLLILSLDERENDTSRKLHSSRAHPHTPMMLERGKGGVVSLIKCMRMSLKYAISICHCLLVNIYSLMMNLALCESKLDLCIGGALSPGVFYDCKPALCLYTNVK